MSPKLVEFPPAPPAENVIGLLEDLLNDARAGKIKGLAVAVYWADENTQSMWSTESGIWSTKMLGAITMLQVDFANRCLEKREE